MVIQSLLSSVAMPVCLLVFLFPCCKHPWVKDQACVCKEVTLDIWISVCSALRPALLGLDHRLSSGNAAEFDHDSRLNHNSAS